MSCRYTHEAKSQVVTCMHSYQRRSTLSHSQAAATHNIPALLCKLAKHCQLQYLEQGDMAVAFTMATTLSVKKKLGCEDGLDKRRGTTILLQCIELTCVHLPLIFVRLSCTNFSVKLSNADVASSRTRIAGPFKTARAKATRCFSPPDSRKPRSPEHRNSSDH